MKWTTALAAGLGASIAAAAEDAPSRHQLSLAAGYKAAFTCSATFNAGRSPDAIAAGELARVYPSYRPVLAASPEAVIDGEAKTVSVAFADDMPPRIAAWRPHLGCAQLPPGSPAERAGDLPRLTAEPPAPAQGDWPADEGGDPRLAPVAGAAFDAASYGEGTRTTALIVMQGGRVLAERYAEGFDAGASQRTWSVAKSISATIIGAAVEQGLLDVAAPAAIPEWSAPGDPRAAITLEHLLHMSSGLDSGERGSRTDRVYFGGGLVAQNAATTSLEAAPGTRWKYANNDTLLAVRALRAALADEEAYHRFPFEAVLWPLGMRDTYLETDWGGEFILSSQVWTTARDLARLALLYLNDGVWEDRRILPEGWASYVSAPSPDQPDSGAFGYGAQFWLLRGVEGLPDDSFAALGHRGQHVVIIPSADVAIVRRGFDESGGTPFDIAAFAADVLAALATASEEG